MNEILRELSMLHLHLLPPATTEEIQRLQDTLGKTLPDEIVLLYQDHGGMSSDVHFPMRLMSPTEVIDTHHEFRTAATPGFNEQIGLFWTDDNSNYGGVFLTGELQGRVCVIDHEEPEDTPKYWNTESFYKHLLHGYRHDLDWAELATDYPLLDSETVYPAKDHDRELGRRYLRLFRESTERGAAVRYAFYAMNLLPPEESHLIVSLLRSSDMWIQERACQVLGKRKYASAVHDLYDIALHGAHNGRIASILALKQITTPAAREYLKRLRDELGESWEVYFR